jgi:uncharacterized protein YPO0396
MNDEQLTFGFDDSDTLAGFRLDRIELLNWGTFHEKVWVMTPVSRNALLTGDIGSGKSTIVDAVTTLLVPAHRVAYNKAAGAEKQERSLRSYVQGYYKLERNESGSGARPVALRNHNSYSVILGVFRNSGYLQTVTIAQVFWQKEAHGQPDRFFVVADDDLSIAADFADFGSDVRNLKKRLRNLGCVDGVYDTFPPYSAAFRRRFGIRNDQAMELFHQTVSMKSVGNLTDFVRSHMLEAFDAASRIEALITHFDDLTRAHDAVLKAKRQIERLRPLVADLDRCAEASTTARQLLECRDALVYYFADIKHELLQKRLHNYEEEHRRISGRVERIQAQLSAQQGERDQLRQAMAENGGDRLERLKSEIHQLSGIKTERLRKFEEYRSLAEKLSLPELDSVDTFSENRSRLETMLAETEREDTELQNERIEAEVSFKKAREQHGDIDDELQSLRNRRSNIDSRQIRIRSDLCGALGIGEEELPFAGELLQVRPEEEIWEGAIERLLRNFGMSLLVPERHYADVSEWVEATHLRGRIVYFKVAETFRSSGDLSLHPDSLVHKIAVKPDTECYAWLEEQLGKRFDFACCESMEQFRREKLALTVAGQIKTAGNRHEKDDRFDIADRSRYILGWSNEAKVAALEKRCRLIEEEIRRMAQRIASVQQRQQQTGDRRILLVKLDGFSRFGELDWQAVALQISDLEQEKQQLESASDVLKTLGRQLADLERSMRETDDQLTAQRHHRSVNETRQEQVQAFIEECRQRLTEIDRGAFKPLFEKLSAMQSEAIGELSLTADSADARQTDMRRWLQAKIDAEEKRIKTLSERIIRNMQDYRRDYVAETTEVDAQLEAGDEFRAMLRQLEADDLPKFEKRFKDLLTENTINEIANFQSQLSRERQEIRERIATINRSLGQIEYNKGRYIVLEDQVNSDIEIREFQQSLRACTEGTLTGSDEEQYTERKFMQVKTIIERFRGREGSVDVDARWTRKVTDVRNWFSFAASERWIEDHSEYEHYTDSGGKSGGQKEKLAYTVLAASLAYQFGLEWGEIRSRSFRFVVIDEAFGRGSDESARFGLELFKRLNLQLLIVTPLQKIHIIEPYVSSVGFVYNPDGRESLLRNLTIEQYTAEKEARTNETMDHDSGRQADS